MHFIEYMDATAREADNRTNDKILTLEDHLILRRNNGGLLPAFDVIEISLGFALPADVLEDSNFQSTVKAANDMVSYSNVRQGH